MGSGGDSSVVDAHAAAIAVLDGRIAPGPAHARFVPLPTPSSARVVCLSSNQQPRRPPDKQPHPHPLRVGTGPSSATAPGADDSVLDALHTAVIDCPIGDALFFHAPCPNPRSVFSTHAGPALLFLLGSLSRHSLCFLFLLYLQHLNSEKKKQKYSNGFKRPLNVAPLHPIPNRAFSPPIRSDPIRPDPTPFTSIVTHLRWSLGKSLPGASLTLAGPGRHTRIRNRSPSRLINTFYHPPNWNPENKTTTDHHDRTPSKPARFGTFSPFFVSFHLFSPFSFSTVGLSFPCCSAGLPPPHSLPVVKSLPFKIKPMGIHPPFVSG